MIVDELRQRYPTAFWTVAAIFGLFVITCFGAQAALLIFVEKQSAKSAAYAKRGQEWDSYWGHLTNGRTQLALSTLRSLQADDAALDDELEKLSIKGEMVLLMAEAGSVEEALAKAAEVDQTNACPDKDCDACTPFDNQVHTLGVLALAGDASKELDAIRRERPAVWRPKDRVHQLFYLSRLVDVLIRCGEVPEAEFLSKDMVFLAERPVTPSEEAEGGSPYVWKFCALANMTYLRVVAEDREGATTLAEEAISIGMKNLEELRAPAVPGSELLPAARSTARLAFSLGRLDRPAHAQAAWSLFRTQLQAAESQFRDDPSARWRVDLVFHRREMLTMASAALEEAKSRGADNSELATTLAGLITELTGPF